MVPTRAVNVIARRDGYNEQVYACKKRIAPGEHPTLRSQHHQYLVPGVLPTTPVPWYNSLFTHFLLIQVDKTFSRSHQTHFHSRCADVQNPCNICTGKAIVFV